MTDDEPMSTPDSGGLRAAVERIAARLHASGWNQGPVAARDLRAALAVHPDPVPTPDSAECWGCGHEHQNDDRVCKACAGETCRDCGAPWVPVRRGECSRCGSDGGPAKPTPDSADDATVGEREVTFGCAHIYPDGMRCRLGAQAHAMPGMSHHEPATPPDDDANRAPGRRCGTCGWAKGHAPSCTVLTPAQERFIDDVAALLSPEAGEVLQEVRAGDTSRLGALMDADPLDDDANRAPVSGGLDEGEREGRGWDSVHDSFCRFGQFCSAHKPGVWAHLAVDLAAHDAAWVERLAAVEGERDDLLVAHGHRDAAIGSYEDALTTAEAERDTARREAGEAGAKALRDAADEVHRESRWSLEKAMQGNPQDAVDRLLVLEKVLRDRADALTSDDGSGA